MFDCTIIGAGVIGLAIGRHLALKGFSVALLEAKATIGQEMSFRNSAVLHAGIYYPPDSLKARLCIQGHPLIRDYCLANSVPYNRLGKLIVAADKKQLAALKALQTKSLQNGVHLKWLTTQELSELEPHVRGIAALLSENTATINGQILIESLKKDLVQAGGKLFTNAKVTACEVADHRFLTTTHHPEMPVINSTLLVNAAGLGAQDVAHTMKNLNKTTIPPLYLAKGNYFKYLLPSPFKHLIYPLPEAAGLGIHATIDINGNLRFGPDVEWIQAPDFKTNQSRKPMFLKAISAYFPEIERDALVPDDSHTGIRPKIQPAALQPQDFLIQTAKSHGIKGLVQLYGIESPGLTSSFAIAEYVYEALIKPPVGQEVV